jgi:DNA-binding NtrC family response regulator
MQAGFMVGQADGSGLALMHKIHNVAPQMRLILMTGSPTVESLARAIRSGASDYLFKPFNRKVLNDAIQRALSTSIPRPM